MGKAREIGFQVFSRGSIPTIAQDRLRQRSTGESVGQRTVSVTAGDSVFAAETGAVVVLAENVDEVLAKAKAVSQHEVAIVADLGSSVLRPELVRMRRYFALAGMRRSWRRTFRSLV